MRDFTIFILNVFWGSAVFVALLAAYSMEPFESGLLMAAYTAIVLTISLGLVVLGGIVAVKLIGDSTREGTQNCGEVEV